MTAETSPIDVSLACSNLGAFNTNSTAIVWLKC